jgi:cytochrome c-type biogenesis protein CcmE
MTKKGKRIVFIISIIAIISSALAILMNSLSKNIMFFMTPTEVMESKHLQDQIIRVGGLVKKNSIHNNNTTIDFILTDCQQDITVYYKGLLPNLFREGQGIIATGKIENNKLFATELLAKHDEKYIPKELYKATINQDMCKNN